MQLNLTTDYAIRTALFLAKEQRIVSSQEISVAMHIPQAYLLKIAKVLAEAGILQAHRGAELYGKKLGSAMLMELTDSKQTKERH